MNYSEVKELLSAGFTAEEIRQMMNNPQNSQNNPQPENPNIPTDSAGERTEKSEPALTPEQDPTADRDSAKTENPNIPNFDALNETMHKLIRTIQSSNLLNNSVQSTAPDIDKQVDGIMASIIRPEHKTN